MIGTRTVVSDRSLYTAFSFFKLNYVLLSTTLIQALTLIIRLGRSSHGDRETELTWQIWSKKLVSALWSVAAVLNLQPSSCTVTSKTIEWRITRSSGWVVSGRGGLDGDGDSGFYYTLLLLIHHVVFHTLRFIISQTHTTDKFVI